MVKPVYNVKEWVNTTKLTKQKVIIVEGINDIRVYEKFAESPSVHIDWIGSISGFAGGCDAIIRLAKELSTCNIESIDSKFLLIIDKDVRDFKGNLPEFSFVFTLKYYSIESYFVSFEHASYFLNFNTRVPRRDLEEISHAFFEEYTKNLRHLYRISLAALSNSLADVKDEKLPSYGEDGAFLNKKYESLALDIQSYEAKLNISESFENLKVICKGKWLISHFVNSLIDFCRSLPQKCQSRSITTCSGCEKGHKPCLYAPQTVTKGEVERCLKEFLRTTDFKHVNERISRFCKGEKYG